MAHGFSRYILSVTVVSITSLSSLGFSFASERSGETSTWIYSETSGFALASSCVAATGASQVNSLQSVVVDEATNQPLEIRRKDLFLPSSGAGTGVSLEGKLLVPIIDKSTVESSQKNPGDHAGVRASLRLENCQLPQGATPVFIYEVFEKGDSTPLARLGLRSSEISHFLSSAATESHDLSLVNQVVASNPRARSTVLGVEAVEGPLEYLVCVAGSSLNVRDETLNRVLFQVNRFEAAKPVQSFGNDKQNKVIGGRNYTFIHVQFPNRPATANQGWVAEEYIKLKSECSDFNPPAPAPLPPSGSWTFPTHSRPTDSYRTGMRRFQAGRGGGARLHAASDLYRRHGDDALAVTSGTVIRDRYYFYEGTYALEVRHSDGKVVRYGEVTGKAAAGVGLGSTLEAGQTLGFIGTVSSGCCSPMLHFEMYSGSQSGALTQGGNRFQRRSDLIDPTSYLMQWEKAKFGQSY